MVDEVNFDADRPSFYLLNVGETHYPYARPDEDTSDLPRISGVHGVFKKLDQIRAEGGEAGEFFDEARLKELHDRQIAVREYLDGVIERLLSIAAGEHLGRGDVRPRRAVR